VKSQEPETPDRGVPVSGPMPLFSESEMGDCRSHWSKVQTSFVENHAGRLETDKSVASVCGDSRQVSPTTGRVRQKQRDQGDNVSTENLRVALQRYRSFLDRLLKP
jgi:hypothetical protein